MTDTKMRFKDALIAHLNGEVVEACSTSTPPPGFQESWEPLMKRLGNYRLNDIDNKAVQPACEFRIKPSTVMCNGVEVPAPESVAPAVGDLYYHPQLYSGAYAGATNWADTDYHHQALERGLVYLNKEDAIARAKAMLITK